MRTAIYEKTKPPRMRDGLYERYRLSYIIQLETVAYRNTKTGIF
jgi:hypothetical protein